MKKIITGLLCAMLILSFATMLVSADTEPNDDYSTAEEIFDGDIITGTLAGDTDAYDYYKIALSLDDTIEIILTGSDTADYDLALYNDEPFYFYIDGSYGGSSDEDIYYTTTESSRYYYIEIEGYGIQAGETYTLSVSVSQSSGGGNGGNGDPWVGGEPYVDGDPKAEVPTPTVGNSVNFGGVKDIGDEFEQELEAGLKELRDAGFDVDVDINGGVGAFFGIEVAGDDSVINGYTCYDVALTGALAIDLGLEASVDGSITESGFTISIDGSGSGFFELEANLDGHLYFTVDEMALAKVDLTLTAEGHGELTLDADMSMQGTSQSITADAELDINGAQVDFELMFDPPLDIYQFPMWEGKEWYVPGFDTDISGSLNAQGTVSYDVNAVVPGEEPINEKQTVNLGSEIGNNDFFETVPGGEPYYGYGDGGTMFTCTKAAGNIFVIETELGDAFGYLDLGTRQLGIPDVDELIPSAGMQYDGQAGMITGMTMDGEVMTEPVTSEEVETFAADPLGEVAGETGGHASGGGGLGGLILIGVIVIIVVILVVVMMTRKKAPPTHHHPQPYQQPPPPPPEYQPQQGQYEQPPPPPDNYQQPPPPPPPGY